MTDTLATKQDLHEMDARNDTRFAKVDARLADLERRMTMRLGGVSVAAVGVVAALVKLL